MSLKAYEENDIQNIANAIREKNKKTDTYKISEMAQAIKNIPSGGVVPTGDYRVRFIDIDGTILKEEYVEAGQSATAPENVNYDPEHLVFKEWNNNFNNIQNDLDVGATYDTIDGSIIIKYETNNLSETTKTITMKYTNPTKAGKIEWGDGTEDVIEVATGNASISHTYSDNGEYAIKISGVENFRFYASNTSDYFLGSYDARNCVTHIYLGHQYYYYMSGYVFTGLGNLKVISFHNKCVFSANSNILITDPCLKALILPRSATSISATGVITALSSLKHFVIPKLSISSVSLQQFFSIEDFPNSVNITSISTSANTAGFMNWYSIKKLNLKNVTSLPTGASAQTFYYCFNLEELYFEKLTTAIANSTNLFNGCGSLTRIILNTAKVIVLNGTNAFKYQKNIKVYVPDNLYEQYIVATNWVSIADRIRKISELEA